MPAAEHNRLLALGRRRAERLEERLTGVLTPILNRAAASAADAFSRSATDYLTAAAPGLTPESTMVALYPRPDEAAELAVEGGEPAGIIHCTLVFLGEIDDETVQRAVDAVRAVAVSHAMLEGTVGGVGAFAPTDGVYPAIVLPDVPGLVELRVAITEALVAAGVDYARDHGYCAHATIAYVPEGGAGIGEPGRFLGQPLHFDRVCVARGNAIVAEIPLVGPPPLTAGGLEMEMIEGGTIALVDGRWVEGVDLDGSLTAATPAWGAPVPNQIVDVDAVVAELRGKTDPVRQAVVETMMVPALNGVGLSFDVTNPLTAQVLSQAGSQIVNIAETTQLNAMRIIRRSYEEGLSIPDTAKAIRVGMREATPARARLIARCLPPETPVDGAVVRAVTRRWYEGDMAVLVTESGREFTATPNHPMLTSRGWRPAGEIDEGDYLVCRGREEHARPPGHEDVCQPPATIAEVFEAAAAVGVLERRTGGQPDFHGDGRECEVDVARPDGELVVGDFAALYEHRGQRGFAPSIMVHGTTFCSRCGHLLPVDQRACVCGAPPPDAGLVQHAGDDAMGYIEAGRDPLGRLASCVAGDDALDVEVVAAARGATATLEVERPRVAERPPVDAARPQPAKDGALVHAYLPGGGSRAGSVAVEADRVVSCRLVEFAGHVYNLMTPYGYFTVNGGYTGNTEMVGAVNGGSLAATKIVASVTGERYQKKWLTGFGARFPRHENYIGLDQQTVPLDDYFSVGGHDLEFPGDPAGPPEEICNCRCALVYVEEGANPAVGESSLLLDIEG